MLIERVEQRVLGALQLVDNVTGTPVKRAMNIRSDTATLVRNRSGNYVITHADGLEPHTAAFQGPPAEPALAANEYSFVITDPQKRYLPRLATIRLPRDPDPDHVGNSDSLFTPQDVEMYAASTAPLSPNWSTIRLSATGADDTPLQGAFIRVSETGGEQQLLARGITDERGEALIIVPGVPVTKFATEEDEGNGDDDDEPPVLVNTLAVTLELSSNPATAWPVNPGLLQQNHAADLKASRTISLSTGKMERVVINLT